MKAASSAASKLSDETGTIDGGLFRKVLSHFATGVSIVTACEDGVPVGFTCQSFTSLSLDPPMIALAPAKTSTSWPKIAKAGAFCVNILSVSQVELCRSFAVSGGDKFAGVSYRSGLGGTPMIEGCLAWVECDLELIYEAGDHELVFGRVRHLEMGAGDPLLFYQGDFGTYCPIEGPRSP